MLLFQTEQAEDVQQILAEYGNDYSKNNVTWNLLYTVVICLKELHATLTKAYRCYAPLRCPKIREFRRDNDNVCHLIRREVFSVFSPRKIQNNCSATYNEASKATLRFLAAATSREKKNYALGARPGHQKARFDSNLMLSMKTSSEFSITCARSPGKMLER